MVKRDETLRIAIRRTHRTPREMAKEMATAKTTFLSNEIN
jgi:hypothetical protein